MSSLSVKSASECRWDEVSLGEVMLRFDPGDRRVRNARSFEVWEGGGEYNVARGLAKCFGLRTAVATALPENDLAKLVEELIQSGGVSLECLVKKTSGRVGINFTERGYGLRGALGVSDRENSAASLLKPGDIDWDAIFAKGVRWFHTGGIFAALSETTPLVAEEAISAAKKYGTVVSYDLNYRPSLWKNKGGIAKCREVNRRLAKFVDVMIGNEEDFTACLGLEVEGVDENLSRLPIDGFKKMIELAVKEYPNFKVCATTLRTVKTASVNDWSAICWHEGEFHKAMQMDSLAIYDRVGGGDSFASGLIYGLLELGDAQKAVEYGCAHGALAMTTPGDTSMASKEEVERVVAGGSARVVR